jgi:hypothetical protein
MLLAGFGWESRGQSLSDRISNAKKSMVSRAASDPTAQALRLNQLKMKQQLPTVSLEGLTASDAMEWLENTADIEVLVNWNRMFEEEGISGDTEVLVAGKNLTVEVAMDMILKQVAIDAPLMWEVTPWYIRVITKKQANANPVLRVYPIGDLLINVPNFTNAPDFDLQSISQSGAGGGGGGSSSSLFDDEDEDEDDEATRTNRAEEIADLIRQSVEPDIWRANGGLYSVITVYQANLIIRAPDYVHKQIGGSSISVSPAGSGLRPVTRGAAPIGTRTPRPSYRERRKTEPDTLYRIPTRRR